MKLNLLTFGLISSLIVTPNLADSFWETFGLDLQPAAGKHYSGDDDQDERPTKYGNKWLHQKESWENDDGPSYKSKKSQWDGDKLNWVPDKPSGQSRRKRLKNGNKKDDDKKKWRKVYHQAETGDDIRYHKDGKNDGYKKGYRTSKKTGGRGVGKNMANGYKVKLNSNHGAKGSHLSSIWDKDKRTRNKNNRNRDNRQSKRKNRPRDQKIHGLPLNIRLNQNRTPSRNHQHHQIHF